jgi:hypothetical protein
VADDDIVADFEVLDVVVAIEDDVAAFELDEDLVNVDVLVTVEVRVN